MSYVKSFMTKSSKTSKYERLADIETPIPQTSSSNQEATISAWTIVTSLSAIILAPENRGRIIAASVLTSITTAMNFVTPYLLGETLDSFVKKHDPNQEVELTPTTLILMLIAAYTVAQVLPKIRDHVLVPVAANSTQKLITRGTQHQLEKSLDYHSKTQFGDQTYFAMKLFTAASVASPLLKDVAPTLFEVVMAVAVLANRYGTGMGAGVAGTAATYMVYSVMTAKSVIDVREVMLNAGNKSWEKISGALKQYKNMHDFGKLSHELEAIEKATKKAAIAEINAITLPLKIGLGHIAIPRLGMLLAALYVGKGVQSGQYSVQDFVLLINYIDKLSTLVPSLGSALNALFASYPDLKFVFNELNKPSEIVDSHPDTPLDVKQTAIRFENVTFAYADKANEQPLLKNLSFAIESGQTAAFVSKSGGGKSTLFKLLYGYNKPLTGRIFINNQDISQVSLKSLQSNISLIAQNPNLFNDTIRENIKYGAKNPDDVTDEQIWKLAKAANLYDFLNAFPQKLDTPVGEEGKSLSGGEQQRVAILRSLFKETPIRLFDEMTSSLDSVSAGKMLQGIEKITEGETKLVITHKLAEAQCADKIFVLADGAVLDQGTHAQLLNSCSLYQALWNEQNKKVADAKIQDRQNLSNTTSDDNKNNSQMSNDNFRRR